MTEIDVWVAKVTKKQIMQFVDEIYSKDNFFKQNEKIYNYTENVNRLKIFIGELDEKKEYALVAMAT